MPSLVRVCETVGECFPTIVEETKIALSVTATLLLEDPKNPVAVNFEGPPSSLKTTIADFFDGADDKVYRSDKFTPRSFVSHSAAVSREKLEQVDLLPRIRHKLFVVPELAPLFGLRNEDLLENFTILTRVFDGAGLLTDSGVHGRRGHSGDYYFAWLGCTTPIPHRVWATMGKLGSRLLFVEMPDDDPSESALVHEIAGGASYKDRVEACRRAVLAFLDELWESTGGVRGVSWDRNADPQPIMVAIAAYAKLLCRLRGTLSIWREGSGDNETYNFTTPIIEKPHRALSLLYALARGHALVHGRRQLNRDDLAIVDRVALESAPNDRRAVMRLLIAKLGVVTTRDVQTALTCSAPTARAILEALSLLKIGRFRNPGPPEPASLTLADSLRWVLEPTEAGIENNLTPCRGRGVPSPPDQPASDPLAPRGNGQTVETDLDKLNWKEYLSVLGRAHRGGLITLTEGRERLKIWTIIHDLRERTLAPNPAAYSRLTVLLGQDAFEERHYWAYEAGEITEEEAVELWDRHQAQLRHRPKEPTR
jgi:hypothetical protein